MYKIKQLPEDFIVREINNIKAEGNGAYSYFMLKKKNYDTVKAIERIAAELKIPVKFIGFAGNKDKKAITEQIISIKTTKKTGNLKLKDICLTYIGKGNEPISLGSNEGNQFMITIRDLTNREINRLKKINKSKILIPNYFGEQRFSKNNIEIGISIIKKDFKKASELAGLKADNNDYIGALRKINKKTLTLYLHAYQSYLFNETVNQYLKINKGKTIENIKIPVIGFGTETGNNQLGKIIGNILKQEKISLRDFIIRQMPELSSEGTERDLFAEVKDFKIRKLEKGKATLSFYLPKGSYATVFIKELFSRQ
ncbi:tRNA pseudouridine(13) synthase TruD [Candidatus Woesearchaeota archaeon]|nr:tRNA pseudouridine(13) synthase TruD [Candidatus Woesearchaeota archaeon]